MRDKARRLNWVLGAGVVAIAWAGSDARAQLVLQASADGQYAYNTDVFQVSSVTAYPGVHLTGLSDRIADYGATVGLTESWRRQSLYGTATGTQYRYDRFTDLNHNEYRLDGGWRGEFGSSIDGNIDVNRTQAMAPFLYLYAPNLVVTTTQTEDGTFGYRIAQRWRVSVDGSDSKTEWPLLQAQSLELKARQGDVKLEYMGPARLNFGITAGYLRGDYYGVTQAQLAALGLPPSTLTTIEQSDISYKQNQIGLTVSEELAKNEKEENARSLLSGDIEYSHRTAATVLDSFSAVTGALRYKRWVTGKTWVQVELSRRINNFVAGAASMLNDAVDITSKWQATYKTGLTAEYSYTYGATPGPATGFVLGRIDRVQLFALGADYEPRRWITIKPYYKFQGRSSDYAPAGFHEQIIGIEATLLWQR